MVGPKQVRVVLTTARRGGGRRGGDDHFRLTSIFSMISTYVRGAEFKVIVTRNFLLLGSLFTFHFSSKASSIQDRHDAVAVAGMK